MTDPTPLAEQIAREHRPSRWRSFANEVEIIRCCGQDFGPHPTRKPKRGDDDKAERDFVAHIATVTERAVREQVAADIRRAAYERAMVVGESPFPGGSWHAGNDRGIGFGLDLAARIARGATDD